MAAVSLADEPVLVHESLTFREEDRKIVSTKGVAILQNIRKAREAIAKRNILVARRRTSHALALLNQAREGSPTLRLQDRIHAAIQRVNEVARFLTRARVDLHHHREQAADAELRDAQDSVMIFVGHASIDVEDDGGGVLLALSKAVAECVDDRRIGCVRLVVSDPQNRNFSVKLALNGITNGATLSALTDDLCETRLPTRLLLALLEELGLLPLLFILFCRPALGFGHFELLLRYGHGDLRTRRESARHLVLVRTASRQECGRAGQNDESELESHEISLSITRSRTF